MYLLKKVFELREKTHSDHEKPFMEHLEDLRVMVFRIVITLLISVIICFAFQEKLMEILREPAEQVMLVKQEATMPDAEKHVGIRVPTVEEWNEAKDLENTAKGLDAEQRGKFYKALGKTDMEFHARSVALLRAAKALPVEKREAFVKGLDTDQEMTRQLLALLESDPETDLSAGSNIRMMSALKPTETFMLSMKLAFFAGIVLAFPLLLMYVLQFVLPGLHQKERRVLWPAMTVGFGLFLGGVLFAYFLVLPKALLFFYEWSGDLGVSNDWRIGEYITFATQFTLLFGLSFELPVIIMVLVKLGLLTYDTMARTRTYAIVAIYVAAAIITPTPDIMTLNLMAVPMLILYEICIWLAYFDRKKQRVREAEEEAEEMARRLARSREMHGSDDCDIHEYDETYDHPEDIEEEGDHGWDEDFEHECDIEGHEEWTEPDDAVTGDGEGNSTKDDDEPKKED
ncbi:MAG: twin-arginine translocase subunit TatC [Luteolibacter sp.]